MNIKLTDKELTKVLKAAEWLGIDSNTLIYNLVIDGVNEIIDAMNSIPKLPKYALGNRSEYVSKLNTKEYNSINFRIPSNITKFKQLTNYLRKYYNNQNSIVFEEDSYNLIAVDISNYKISPSNLEDYLEYNYPNSKVNIL